MKLIDLNTHPIITRGALGFGVVVLGAIIVGSSYAPFREEVNEIYNSIYLQIFVYPTMDTVADKTVNIAYCHTTSRLQKLDVYTPKRAEKPVPVVLQIHGGGWTGGDKANAIVNDYGSEIVKNGMALVSVNYRLAPAYTYPAQNQDIDCALSYLILHAGRLNINMAKIGLLGDSAGGQLAAMTAFDSPNKKHVKAVVEYYGTSDLWAQITRKPNKDRNAIAYIGSANNQALAKKASPLYADQVGAPPFLLFHGTDDRIVRYSQSVSFAQKLKQAGVDVTLRTIEQAGHDFSSKSTSVKNSIKAETVSFFKKYLF
ncbi:MAG: alpha/beta hydrolase [Candidatus Saccharibacteria bacterium]